MRVFSLFVMIILLSTFSLFVQTISDEPDPPRCVFNAKPPKCLNLTEVQNNIILPREAIEMNLSGKVIVCMLIDENGCYIKHIPPKAAHPLLIKAVEKHLPELRFEPAMQSGKLIKFWVNVPFTLFTLH